VLTEAPHHEKKAQKWAFSGIKSAAALSFIAGAATKYIAF
jgi:hypothetical protein